MKIDNYKVDINKIYHKIFSRVKTEWNNEEQEEKQQDNDCILGNRFIQILIYIIINKPNARYACNQTSEIK